MMKKKKILCFAALPIIFIILTFAAVKGIIGSIDFVCEKLGSADLARILSQFETAELSFPFIIPVIFGFASSFFVYKFTSFKIPLRILSVIIIVFLLICSVLLSFWLLKFNGIGVSVIAKILYDLFSGGALNELL